METIFNSKTKREANFAPPNKDSVRSLRPLADMLKGKRQIQSLTTLLLFRVGRVYIIIKFVTVKKGVDPIKAAIINTPHHHWRKSETIPGSA